jgi:glycosyltransferase involved in cell wall biosynthesis
MAKQQRLREGRSSVEGLSARPWPGLASPRLTFTGRFRADKAPDVLVEALALLDAPPPAYPVGDGPARQALIRLVRARRLQRVVRLPGWSISRPAMSLGPPSIEEHKADLERAAAQSTFTNSLKLLRQARASWPGIASRRGRRHR